MSGFSNAVVGGVNKLIRAAIQSPNYILGTTGWTINKDGSAEFNNVTVRGTITSGTFKGTNFIINSAGAFFYSGTPVNGNLLIAIATSSGTDSFSNHYGEGISLIGTTPTGQPALQFPVNVVTAELVNAFAFSYGINIGGANEGSAFQIQGAQETGFPDLASLVMFSSGKAGPAGAAGYLIYYDTAHTQHNIGIWDSKGFHVPNGLYGNGNTLTVNESLLPAGDGNAFKGSNTSYPSGSSSSDPDLSIVGLVTGTYEVKAYVEVQSGANTTGLNCLLQTNGTAGQNQFVVGCNRIPPSGAFASQAFAGDGASPQTYTIGTPSSANFTGIFEGTLHVTAPPAQLQFSFGPIGGTTPINVTRGSYLKATRML